MSAEQSPSLGPVIAIRKDIKDPGTGAPASYHVVSAYQVGLLYGGSAVVTFAGYFSREACDAGLQPLAHVTLQMKKVPAGDSAGFPAWFIEQVLAGEVVLLAGQTEHPLAGAVPVHAEEPAA